MLSYSHHANVYFYKRVTKCALPSFLEKTNKTKYFKVIFLGFYSILICIT